MVKNHKNYKNNNKDNRGVKMENSLEEKTKTLAETSGRAFKTEPREIYLTGDQSLEGYTLNRVALLNGQKYNGFASGLVEDKETRRLYEIIETSRDDLPQVRKSVQIDFALIPRSAEKYNDRDLQNFNKPQEYCGILKENGLPNFDSIKPLLDALSIASSEQKKKVDEYQRLAREIFEHVNKRVNDRPARIGAYKIR